MALPCEWADEYARDCGKQAIEVIMNLNVLVPPSAEVAVSAAGRGRKKVVS
jgi:hypothetical protein